MLWNINNAARCMERKSRLHQYKVKILYVTIMLWSFFAHLIRSKLKKWCPCKLQLKYTEHQNSKNLAIQILCKCYFCCYRHLFPRWSIDYIIGKPIMPWNYSKTFLLQALLLWLLSSKVVSLKTTWKELECHSFVLLHS